MYCVVHVHVIGSQTEVDAWALALPGRNAALGPINGAT